MEQQQQHQQQIQMGATASNANKATTSNSNRATAPNSTKTIASNSNRAIASNLTTAFRYHFVYTKQSLIAEKSLFWQGQTNLLQETEYLFKDTSLNGKVTQVPRPSRGYSHYVMAWDKTSIPQGMPLQSPPLTIYIDPTPRSHLILQVAMSKAKTVGF
eukprot:8641104-Ditylum_brightwellii.AAC.1